MSKKTHQNFLSHLKEIPWQELSSPMTKDAHLDIRAVSCFETPISDGHGTICNPNDRCPISADIHEFLPWGSLKAWPKLVLQAPAESSLSALT